MTRLSATVRLLAILYQILAPVQAVSMNCDHVRVDHHSYRGFGKLDKKYTLTSYSPGESDRIIKTEFDFNVCQAIKKEGGSREGCPAYSHICGIESLLDKDEKVIQEASKHYPIAVDGTMSEGRLNPKWETTKNGLQLALHGLTPKGEPGLMAVIQFQCNKEEDSKRAMEIGSRKKEDEDDDKNDFAHDHPGLEKERTTKDGDGGKITFQSFEYEDKVDGVEGESGGKKVLRLQWETQHACRSTADEDEDDDVDDDQGGKAKGGWGFFSWLFFLSFIGLIAYFSFFGWINYTRYGKSGFDMLPHADTLRELPHLIGEFVSKVINTLRGGHAGGGYSAL